MKLFNINYLIIEAIGVRTVGITRVEAAKIEHVEKHAWSILKDEQDDEFNELIKLEIEVHQYTGDDGIYPTYSVLATSFTPNF